MKIRQRDEATRREQPGPSVEERHRMTLEALADVDTGRVIDHEAIQAWADSLETARPLPPPTALS